MRMRWSMERKVMLLNYIPRVVALSYSISIIAWWLMYHSFLPYWYIWLAIVGVVYAIKDLYLEGETKLKVEELEKYPSWVKNHVVYGLDGYVRIKRRILVESL